MAEFAEINGILGAKKRTHFFGDQWMDLQTTFRKA